METIASLFASLSQLFAPDLQRQYNRQAVFGSLIDSEVGRGDAKNVAWGVQFSGATAQAVDEGSDVDPSEFATDVPIDAILPWATYRSAFQISEQAIDAAIRSAGSPEALIDIFQERVLNAGTILSSTINGDLFSGTGTSASGKLNIVGIFGGALEQSGVYAGLSRSLYSEWQSTVLGNSGIARALSFDLLAQLEAQIFSKCGETPDLIITTGGIVRKYDQLFETTRRIQGSRDLVYSTGPEEAMAPQAEQRYWRGIPIVRDRNAPAGYLAMVNRNYFKMKYLPHRNPGDAFGYSEGALQGSSGGQGGKTLVTPIKVPYRIVLLGKTGDNVKAEMKTLVQLATTRPNSSGYIKDIAE